MMCELGIEYTYVPLRLIRKYVVELGPDFVPWLFWLYGVRLMQYCAMVGYELEL
jgi:hypothetical protein